MESLTYIKNVQITPKKLRFIIADVRRMKPSEALDYLFYTPKESAILLRKAIQSAISSAKNALKIDERLLRFKLLTIEEGQKLKRFNPGGRGTVKPYIKRFSHIKIILEGERPSEKKAPAKVEAKAKPEVKERKIQVKEKKA
ncbi:hypothetical protein HYW87_01450 [Candidatus Roizmanbacteria bacterium]|nr:hypothetical protein [Candidatus Roizmanbacteria bacterium]